MIKHLLFLTILLICAAPSFAAEVKRVKTSTAYKDPVTKMEFVFIKGGCFMMGNNLDENDKPVHEVCISDFFIGKFEVTQAQWHAVMKNNPSHFKACGADCPVENVSWDDVQEFIGRLNRQSAKFYRLPTEAEWEFAARSGGKQKKTLSDELVDAVAWKHGNSDSKTHKVGQKRPNNLGIYDMSGNVFEWCHDWYDSSYYEESPRDNPQGPTSASTRVIRGGGWRSSGEVQPTFRASDFPETRDGAMGFRLVYQVR